MTVTSDKGSQLTGAANYVSWNTEESPANWDWNKISEESAMQNTEWKFVAAGCQFRNGLAERRVGATKSTLNHLLGSTLIGMKPTLNYAELQCVLSRAADIINDRPLGVRYLTNEDLVPITPNQLLQGRTTTARKQPTAEEIESFSHISKYQDELLSVWWKTWIHQVFPSLLPYNKYKDTKRNSNLKEGDVCLLKYDSKVKARYKLCIVSVILPHDDGTVRTVRVKYRASQKKEDALPYIPRPLTELEVAVQRLVLIQAVEDLEDSDPKQTPEDEVERTGSHLGEQSEKRISHQGKKGSTSPPASELKGIPGLNSPGMTLNSSGFRDPHDMGPAGSLSARENDDMANLLVNPQNKEEVRYEEVPKFDKFSPKL